MELVVNGTKVFAGTGGREFDPSRPAVVFLHGAGFDRTVWALLARWFAHRGYSVLAPDFPGHGRSAGEPLASIGALADWTVAAMQAAGATKAAFVGHSMGGIVAVEIAARHPETATALALIGTAGAMPVSKDLLAAAKANDYAAVEMVSIWGKGFRGSVGGSLAPGLWMLGGAARVLERQRPGVLFKALTACHEYRDGLASAAKVKVPTTVVLGERDLMTPVKGGKALAAALPNARVVVLEGAGHMLMAERPDEVLDAVKDFARVNG